MTLAIENVNGVDSGLIIQPLLKAIAILIGRNESYVISRKFIKSDKSVMSGEFISQSTCPFSFVEKYLYTKWSDMNSYFLLSRSPKILDQHVLNLPPIMVLSDISPEERLNMLMYPLVNSAHLKSASELKSVIFNGSILPNLAMPLYSIIYYLLQITGYSKNKLNLSEFFSLLYTIVYLACVRTLLSDSANSLSNNSTISFKVDAPASKPSKSIVSILSQYQLVVSTISSYSNLIGCNDLCSCEFSKSFMFAMSDPRFLYHTKLLILFNDCISTLSNLSKNDFITESLKLSVKMARNCVGLNPLFPKEVLSDSLCNLFTVQCQWMINQINLVLPKFFDEFSNTNNNIESKIVELNPTFKKENSHSLVIPPQITSVNELEDLPIMKYEELILNQIKDKPVIIIQGETGMIFKYFIYY